ncbi:MAG: glycosyltransferase family 4 protein [bacterium]|nr:glycosyltransferase family 4 protein [bacterium]
MTRHRVLYICHNHPEVYVGGAEVCAWELFQAMREAGEFEPVFLARTAAPGYRSHNGTPFRALNDDANQVLWYQEEYIPFFMTTRRKEQFTVHFHRFLTTYRPDVVHIQHTYGLGFDLIRQIHHSLPGVPIVYTLHEFFPICQAEGHMLRTTREGELCRRATPARCHECAPEESPPQHFLRERFIRSHFALVDLFLAPSRFLLERYLDWGIPAAKLRFQENGRVLRTPLDGEGREDSPSPGQIAFFGQLSPHKGIAVLLQAMKLVSVSEGSAVHLFLNGANLESQSEEFQVEVSTLLRECRGNVTVLGKYRTSEIPQRMRAVAWVVVPSLWWENAPLVIQEAFMHGRPVISSDVGGMAEKVTAGVNGLHFRIGDPADLAATLVRAAGTPGLWERLREGIPPVYSIEDSVKAHGLIYRSLMDRTGTGEGES